MSCSGLPSEEEDPHCTDDAGSTVSADSVYVAEIRRTANYFLIDDPNEPRRLDDMWEMERGVLGSLHRSKLYRPHEILDIGTGTGRWAIEIADACPSASVIGFDVSPIQPNWVPPNLEWHLGDLQYDLNYESNRFYYIYVRHMDGCVPRWDKFFGNVYRMLEQGGYVELLDYSFRIEYGEERDTRYLSTLMNDLQRAAERRGTPLNMAPRYSSQLENAGFRNINVEKRSIDVYHNLDLVRRSLNAYAKGLLAPNASQSVSNEATLRACLAANELKEGNI